MHSHLDQYLLMSRPGLGLHPAYREHHHYRHTHPPSGRRLHRRAAALVARLARPSRRAGETSPAPQGAGGELDIHGYLELEFAVEDRYGAGETTVQ